MALSEETKAQVEELVDETITNLKYGFEAIKAEILYFVDEMKRLKEEEKNARSN